MVKLIQQPTAGVDLLEQYRQDGSPETFAQIMRAYGGMVLSVCYKVTKDAADAEDASQAVFLTLAVQCKTGSPIQFLGPWLKKVAKRTALDMVRSKKRRTRRETVTAENRPEHYDVRPGAAPEADELNAMIRAELDELPGKYRMPLVLHYFGGMSHEQISREMNCTTAALGVRLHRARKMLGKRLSARGISLEGMALSAALAVAIPAVFTERFVQSTQAAAVGLGVGTGVALGTGQSVAAFGSFGLPGHLSAVLGMVNQIGTTVAKQRLKMATLAMAAGVSLLGGAAEAVRCLPASIRPNLDFLAPSQLLKSLLTPQLPTLRTQAAPPQTVQTAKFDGVDLGKTPAAYTGTASTASLMGNVINQPVLALQWSPPVPAPSTTGPGAPIPKLSLTASVPPRPVAPSTLASTAAAVIPQARSTQTAIPSFHNAAGGNAPTPAADTPGISAPSSANGPRREGPEIQSAPPDALQRPVSSNVPNTRVLPGLNLSAVGGATHNHVPAVNPYPGRVDGPRQVPADANFVPSSIELRHGDVFVPGDGKYAWYDKTAGIAKSGTNAAELAFTGVTPGGGGVLSVERIPVTTTAAPVRPTGHHFVGIWSLNTTFDYSSIDLTAHYDLAFAQSLGLEENVLKLWVYDPKQSDWIRIMDGTFSRDLVNHTVSGTYAGGEVTFFAVSAPEPATLGVAAVVGGLLLRRRRKC